MDGWFSGSVDQRCIYVTPIRLVLLLNTNQISCYKGKRYVRKFDPVTVQSRAQSSPAPQSAVGRRGELWGHGIFTAEIVRFRFLCACLGEKRKSSEVITKSTSSSHYMIDKGGISVKRA